MAGLLLPASALAIVPGLEALLGTTSVITAPASAELSPFDLAATVSPSAATGTVTFKFNQAQSQIHNATACTAPLTGGTASCSVSGLAVGAYTMWASYGGDATYGASDSNTVTMTNYAPTSTFTVPSLAVIGVPNPSAPNQRVTITATASASGTIDGDLWFQEDGRNTALCPPTRLVGRRTATGACSTAFTGAGEHSIMAYYCAGSAVAVGLGTQCVRVDVRVVGQTGVTGAGYTQSVQNQPDSTFTIILAAPNPAGSGEAIAFTAAVGGSVGIPTGAVSLRENGVDIGCTITLASGRGACNRSLSAGTHIIIASYRGEGAFGPSTSQPLMVTVNAAGLPRAEAAPRSGQAILPSGQTANAVLSAAGAGLLRATTPDVADQLNSMLQNLGVPPDADPETVLAALLDAAPPDIADALLALSPDDQLAVVQQLLTPPAPDAPGPPETSTAPDSAFVSDGVSAPDAALDSVDAPGADAQSE